MVHFIFNCKTKHFLSVTCYQILDYWLAKFTSNVFPSLEKIKLQVSTCSIFEPLPVKVSYGY